MNKKSMKKIESKIVRKNPAGHGKKDGVTCETSKQRIEVH